MQTNSTARNKCYHMHSIEATEVKTTEKGSQGTSAYLYKVTCLSVFQ